MSQINLNLLKNISKDFQNILARIVDKESDFVNYRSELIACNLLDLKYLSEDIRYSVDFKHVFDNLRKEAPTLYVFEIISEHDISEVKAKYVEYASHGDRRTAAFFKTKNEGSKILYVGKVKQNNEGRFVAHLGVGLKPVWHGLQLAHWAKDLGIKLKLHIFEFEQDMNENLLSAIESEAAKILNPLIGKHA